MTLRQINLWMKSAKAGDSIVYHTGKQLSSKPNTHDYSAAVHAVRHLYNLGLVHLVQKRIEGGFFQYIAVKRENVSPPLPAFATEGQPVHRFTGIPSSIAAGA